MAYELRIYEKPAYLHAVVTGENTRENVENYLAELVLECKTRKCTRLLIEERLEGPRLGSADVFSIAAQGSESALGTFKRVAYVDANAVGDKMHFAETVARNRGVPVSLFSSVADAEKWITEK